MPLQHSEQPPGTAVPTREARSAHADSQRPVPTRRGRLVPMACGLTWAASVALSGCAKDDSSDPPAPALSDPRPAGPAESPSGGFPDEAAARGLDYVNASGEPDKATILEANGAGVAVIDLQRDGDLDLVFAQGLGSIGQLLSGPGADLEPFLNDGTGRFGRTSGPGLSGWWTGLATGDLDGDGDADLVAGGFGQLEVLLQDDAGQLIVVDDPGTLPEGPARLEVGRAREAGLPPAWTTSLATIDIDADGYLDLYVGQYLDLDPVAPPLGSLGEGALAVPCLWKGHTVYCGPRGMVPQGDRILRGLGDGRFEDRTADWLPDHEPGFTLGVLPLDADRDGDSDVYVANDSVANLLLVNMDGARFTDVGPTAGVALNQDGMPEAGMGVAAGDVDRDGRSDLAVTNFSDEPTQVFLANDTGFRTATYDLGLGYATKRLLSWGVHLEDFNGDGWLELFTANGHVYPQADEPATGTRYGQKDTLWTLLPYKRARAVEPITEQSILARAVGTRGTAVGDFDGDGAPDLVAVTIDGPAALGLNRFAPGAHRLVVRLEGATAEAESGRRSPRDGQGASVLLVPETEEYGLLRQLHTASGYQSASACELYFATGDLARFARLEVRWPSGAVDVVEAGPMDRRLTIREGEGVVGDESLRDS